MGLNFSNLQVDRVYLSSSDAVAVFDHKRKRTFLVTKGGLPDVGRPFFCFPSFFFFSLQPLKSALK